MEGIYEIMSVGKGRNIYIKTLYSKSRASVYQQASTQDPGHDLGI